MALAGGRRLAFEQRDTDGRHVDIWIRDLATNGTTRFTFGPGLNEIPVWSPDGKRIAYGSSRKLNFSAYQKNAAGSGSEREIADLGGQTEGVWDWSRDDKYVLARKDNELVSGIAGFPCAAVPAAEVDRAQCAVLAGWKMGGVCIE